MKDLVAKPHSTTLMVLMWLSPLFWDQRMTVGAKVNERELETGYDVIDHNKANHQDDK